MKVEFWSSSEYSGFLVGLIRELRKSGVNTVQEFHIQEATYRKSSTFLGRSLLRLRQYFVYPIILVGHLLWGRLTGRSADVVVVSTNTFYAPLLATFFHPRVVHLVYDLFPEALIHSGKLEDGTRSVRWIRWLTARTIERAHRNVFLGERLFRYVQSIHPLIPDAVVIPVGADESLFSASPKERLKYEGMNVAECESGKGTEGRGQRSEDGGPGAGDVPTFKLSHSEPQDQSSAPTILYCGNFGNMHDSATLFAYLKSCAGQTDTDAAAIRWVFRCSGPKFGLLQNFLSTQPSDSRLKMDVGFGLNQADWIREMEAADVALVTMIPGSETVVMPSKAYSAMMAGQALLVVAPEASDLVDLVKRSACGWWVVPGDIQAFRRAVHEIATEPEGLLKKREAAFQYAHAHLGQGRLAALWQATLRLNLERPSSARKRIWIFNPFDDVPGEGQAQRYATLADELTRAGHEVVWWSSDFSHRRKASRTIEAADASRAYAVRLVETPRYAKNVSFGRIWSHSRFGANLYREALRSVRSRESVPPDIILASSPPLEGAVVALRLKKRFHCQVITDMMDLWPKTLIQAVPVWGRSFGQLFLLPYYQMLNRACRESDRLCSQSHTYADFAMKHGANTRPYVCYLGARPLVDRGPVASPATTVRLLYLGAMGRSYDLESILDAVQLLVAEGVAVECVLVGDGDKRARLEARNVPGVRFTGYLQGDQLAAELSAADLGIIPFFPESGVAIPYKAGDYLSYGLPLLSTIEGELAELIRKFQCGITYPVANPRALADAIRQYTNDVDRLGAEKVQAKACFNAHFDRANIYPEFVKWITENGGEKVGPHV